MLKKMNKKGFTLAELLIVVAIIAVLVAISIPIFSAQLEKAKEATDMANIRSAYAEVVTGYLGDSTKTYTISVDLKSNTNDYVSDQNAEIAGVKYSEILGNKAKTCIVEVTKDGKLTIGGKEAKTSKLSTSN
ncbi:MAG: prepilin-type N-terminal cleavage/methylation domain-containing protein [Lachnospiraceae bacterium]|nr:prepilin-type N-terminal cleavage/methylation domain-containing protein [Lachnospiraceae bacterium]